MYKNEATLELSDVKSNNDLLKQVSEIINNAKDEETNKITERKIKFSYPKNGLYGLL